MLQFFLLSGLFLICFLLESLDYHETLLNSGKLPNKPYNFDTGSLASGWLISYCNCGYFDSTPCGYESHLNYLILPLVGTNPDGYFDSTLGGYESHLNFLILPLVSTNPDGFFDSTLTGYESSLNVLILPLVGTNPDGCQQCLLYIKLAYFWLLGKIQKSSFDKKKRPLTINNKYKLMMTLSKKYYMLRFFYKKVFIIVMILQLY